ncbi:MAG: glycosyltransferase family 4 protein [Candidatus Omnitrophica bacterium]|nr:glycosyltransferase family 4 protein [Candidatus Omnitrophota bacterium]MDD5352362.1 glycosyltransferase family 4 protein [Candidatus Omnitrophota bacterium]MDD5549960.1 glycosyltransferase family 4 protein [Candidatus Omnitrophota bacterium]
MKIILAAKCVHPFHPFGGIQKYVYNYAKFLAKEGVETEIVAPLDKGKPRTEIYEGIKYTLLAPRIYQYLEYPIGWLGVHIFSLNLAKYLKNIEFDLLHTFDITGYQYLKRKKRKPVITHIFTDNYMCNSIPIWKLASFWGHNIDNIKRNKIAISPEAGKMTILKYPFQYFLKIKPIQYCLTKSDLVFSEQEIFRREIIELYNINPKKCHIAPVGIDMSFINSRLSENRITRKAIGIMENDLVLLTVARLAADKGVDKVIHAFIDIKRKLPNIKLIIIGSGYQEKEILKLIADNRLKNDVFHFKNIPEEELYGFYRISDIYISALSFLASSISALEAMACFLPIITTAQPWLVKNNENGITLENNEPKSISDAVIRLVEAGQLKQKGQISNRIAQDYDWKNIVRSAKQKYEQILSN